MTTSNSNAPAPGTPAPSTPAAGGAPAPSSAPAPAPSAPASSGGGGGSDAAYWKAEAEKARGDRDKLKSKLRERGEAEDQAARAAMEEELAQKTKVEADLLGKLQERNRADARGHFVDAILARVPEGQREDVELRLAGLEQKGELSIPGDYPDDVTPADLRKLATEAAGAELTTLVDRYPGWFAGGSTGVGTPAGPGGGPMPKDWMALSPEEQRNMSDEDFAKHYGSQRTTKKRRTLMG